MPRPYRITKIRTDRTHFTMELLREIRAEVAAGGFIRQVCKDRGIVPGNLYRWCKRRGIRPISAALAKRNTKRRLERIGLYGVGKTPLAKRAALLRRRKALGFATVAERDAAIVADHKHGMSYRKLADKYAMHYQAIYKLFKRRRARG